MTPSTTTTIDCSAGGTTLTLAGNGASYLIVPQFPTNTAPVSLVSYQLFTGNVAAAAASMSRISAARRMLAAMSGASLTGTLPHSRNMTAQHAAEKALRA